MTATRARSFIALTLGTACTSSALVGKPPSAVRRLPGDVPRAADVSEFLDSYRRAFAAFDAEAIADLFAYPCQLTSGDDEIAVTTVPTREAWLPQVGRLVAAYRVIDVR